MAGVGLDVAAVEALRARHEAGLKRDADRRRDAQIARSASTRAIVEEEVAARRRLIELLPGKGPKFPYYETLDHPELISATPNANLESLHVEPFNSWGRIKLEDTSDTASGFAELVFHFAWRNPGSAVLINADAYVVLNGSCEASVPSGFGYGAYSLANLFVTAEMVPWFWGETPVAAPAAFEEVTALYPRNSGWAPLPYSSGQTLIQPVLRGYDLRAESLVVPRNGTMVFEVILQATYQILNGGRVVVDFASGEFNALSPAVLITVVRTVRTPPVVLGSPTLFGG